MPSLEWVLPRLRANEITIVDISFGNIGDEGVRLILDALPVNTSLKTLLLWRNKIGPEGARLLADALRVNTSLKELKLTGNSIGDEGARHLADALRVNVSLEKLSLCATDIGEEGARLLADALSVNVALKLLDLDVGNNVSKARKKEISDLLQPKAREQRAAAAAEKQRQEREAARPATPSTTTTGDPSATFSALSPSPTASIPADQAIVDVAMSCAAAAVPVAFNPIASSTMPPPSDSHAAATVPVSGRGGATSTPREISFDAVKKGDEIGRGGLGVVYSGQWGHEEVALKEAKGLAPNDVADLVREAQAMQQLHSPHVVSLYGVALREVAGQSSTAVLVMELMRGGSLHALLHSSEPLPWVRRLQIVTEVAKGLRYMHQVDFLHRDVKSGNVLLDEYGRAKVADFGFARVKHSLSAQSTRHHSAGTPLWMAPELFKRRSRYTKACDVYSFGILMWEVAARAQPFADAHTPEVAIGWIKEGEREDIPEGTPPPYAGLLQRCWSTDAMARPSMDVVVQKLARIDIGGGPSSSRVPSTATSFAPPPAASSRFGSDQDSDGADSDAKDAMLDAGGGGMESNPKNNRASSGGERAAITDSTVESVRAKLVFGKRKKMLRIDLQCDDLYAWLCDRGRQRFPEELGGGAAFKVTCQDPEGEEYDVDCDEDVREAVKFAAEAVVAFHFSSL